MSDTVTLRSLDMKLNGIGREVGDVKKALNGNGRPGLIQNMASTEVRVEQLEKDATKREEHCEKMHASTPESRAAVKGNTLNIISLIVSAIVGVAAIIVAVVA